MSLHINYNHQCPVCKAHYIPYNSAVACPRCGLVERDRFDFIPQAAESLRYNKRTTGSYVPAAWYVSSLADHVLHILFHLIDGHDALPDPKPTFEAYLEDVLPNMDWGDQPYMEPHIHGIALRVYAELQPVAYAQGR